MAQHIFNTILRKGIFTVTRSIGVALVGLILLMQTASVRAQSVWTGANGTDWNNPLNWNPNGVPTAASDVVLSGVPVFINTAAVAKSVQMTAVLLTINAGGSLTINGSVNANGTTQAMLNFSGAVQNNGTLSIGSTTQCGQNGLTNVGSFVNNATGQIFISNASNQGIENLGGGFANYGSITLGSNGSVGPTAIRNFGPAFDNNGCSALIKILSNANITNGGGGVLNNSGLIIENASGNSNITNNTGFIQNLNGGTFSIDNNTGMLTNATGRFWFVNASAPAGGTGYTWACAFNDLQNALAAASSSDQIWVAAGTYKPTSGSDRSISFAMKDGVEILGGFPNTGNPGLGDRNWVSNVTTLSGDLLGNDGANFANNGENSYHVIFNNNNVLTSTAVLDGFIIRGGKAEGNYPDNAGGGMCNIASSPSVTNCIFTENSGHLGGGMLISFSTPIVTNCSFLGNRATEGGGSYIFANASPNMTNCTFAGNLADFGGGILNEESSSSVTNCTFSENSAAYGGGIFNDSSSPNVTHCAFSENWAASYGGGMYNDESFPNVINCTFYGNLLGSGYGGGIYNQLSAPTITNCILWNNAGNEIQEYISASNVYYSIVQDGFSGMGNLDTDPLFVDATNGNFHLQACSPAIDAGVDAANGATNDLGGNARKFDAITGGQMIDMGVYEYQSNISNGSIWYVNATAPSGQNGTSWACAFHDLQQALAVADAGDQIWTATGTYKPTSGTDRAISFAMKNGVQILGGFPNTGNPGLGNRNWATNPTILSGEIGAAGNSDNSYHVILNNNGQNSTAVLDGFTVRDGKAEGSYPGDAGGGMSNFGASPSVKNCIFTGNSAGYGGGMFNSGAAPSVTNCAFFGNSAGYGGGLYNFAGSAANLTNCTFSQNSANSTVGGMQNDGSSPNVTNCIFWGNGYEIYSTSGSPTVTYSIVQGGYGGTGNLNLDPLFVNAAGGDLRLQACSPAIDAGSDTGNGITTDLGSNARKFEAITGGQMIDMGAYEYQQTAPMPTALCKTTYTAVLNTTNVSVTPANINNGSVDNNCGAVTLSINGQSSIAYTCGDIGQHTVTLSVYAAQSNRTSTCQTTVTVADKTPPTAVCQNISVNLSGNSAGITAGQVLNAGASSDNCGTVSAQSVSPNSFGCANTGSNTVTLTANDGKGNTATCTATVTVNDVTPPTVVCRNITVSLSGSSASITASQVLNAALSSDNCGTVNAQSVSPSSFNCANTASPSTVTLTANDGKGNTATCAATVTVNDVTPPTVVCQNITVNLNGSSASVTASQVLNAALSSDNCGTVNAQSVSPNSFNCASTASPSTVTLTANDGKGNTATCTATVTVNDVTPPTVVCQNITVNLSGGSASITASQVFNAALSTDNCGTMNAQSVSPSSFNCANTASPSTVTLTANDGKGNTATCTATVTVNDVTPPTVACQSIAVNLVANSANITASQVLNAALSSDNCGMVNAQSVSNGSFTCVNVGINVVILTANDGKGNTATCTATVIVVDNTPPTVACQNIAVNLNGNSAGIAASQVLNAALSSDNCGTVTPVSVTPNSFTCANIGPNTVTLTANDGKGNTATCTATVTVNDVAPPSIVCPANVIRANDLGQCGATVTYPQPTGADNCGNPTFNLLSTPNTANGSSFPVGTTTVQWAATDGGGLSATCTFTVTVIDSQAPNITCPTNQAVGTDAGQCYATVSFTMPTGSDNCALPSNAVVQTTGPASGTAFPKGTNTVVFKVTDAAGLTKTCSFRVIVSDAQNPTIVCPGAVSVPAAAGQCSAVVTYTTPTATDNCVPAPTVVRIGGTASGSTVAVGNSVAIWRAIDGAGRSSTCSISITVTDNQAPTIVCPQNIEQANPPGACNAPVFYPTPTATDNCGINTLFMVEGMASGSFFPVGVTSVVWRAVDNNGLSATCSFSVMVSCGAYRPFGDVAQRSPDMHTSAPNGVRRYVLSPNPAAETVDIIWDGAAPEHVAVFDAQGRLVWEQATDTEARALRLDVSDWTAGVYLVLLYSRDTVVVKRLVVGKDFRR